MAQLPGKIDSIPFLRILPPIVLGIVVAASCSISQWLVWGGLAVVYGCAWATYRHPRVGWIYSWAALMLTAMALTGIKNTSPALPQGEKLLVQLQITDNPAPSGRWNTTTACIGYYRTQDESVWHPADLKILLSIDTCYRVGVGEQLVCRAYLNPITRGDTLSGYARLMAVRGFNYRSYITPGGVVVRSPAVAQGPAALAKRMQRGAMQRLSRLDMQPDCESVAVTMTTGERRSLTPALKAAYSRVGASHLLSVSGLHVGIVFVLVNCLLYLLPMVRRGHIVKNIVAIGAIWTFAAMTGLSPSAMRAALMFSGAQIALASTLYRSGINILLGTAAVMLLLNPMDLYDVSFQLSMLAVLGIAVLYQPVYSRLRTGRKILDFVIGITVVGLVATVATAPLVAYYFNNFPILGLLINVPVILASHAVVLLSMVWIIAPIEALQPVMSWLLNTAGGIQNAVVEWCAGLPGAAMEVHLTGWGLGAIYLGYLVVFVLVSASGKRERDYFDK